MSTKERTRTTATYRLGALLLAAACLCGQLLLIQTVAAADEAQRQQTDLRSTQPTLDRQVESPGSGPSAAAAGNPAAKPVQQQAPPAGSPATSSEPAKPSAVSKPQKPSSASQKKAAAALAAHRDYDKYQLKASSSTSLSRSAETAAAASNAEAAKQAADKEREKATGGSNKINNNANKDNKQVAAAAPEASESNSNTNKIGQLPNTRPQPKASAFSILKRFLPSFMTSAAAAAAAATAVADKQPGQNQHSRSSPAASSSLLSSLLSASAGHPATSAGRSGGSSLIGESNAGSPLSGKIINLLTGVQKKKGPSDGLAQAIPNHAPFFMRKSAADRQAAGGGGALSLASGLLSSPLKLGLLFSAPLLPSLLLTPLAIAGLSPAMSAINNFFGDDDEPAASSSAQSSLSTLVGGGSSSPLASILQATGAGPFSADSSGSSSSSSSNSGSNSLALQALQSFVLGPSSTTERPIFKPGVFASASGIQNAAGAISSAISSATGGSSPSSSNSNQRPLFGSGGGLMQAAASMISPSFAAPPASSTSGTSSSGNNDDDDGPGLIQMASDVFEKVANYMNTDNTKDGQAIAQASPAANSQANSPLSTLASLSSLSPIQLSSLFASTPIATAVGGSTSGTSSSSIGNKNQRIGFFSTLRNVYELFSSSFLRRQEVGNENECQQRLVCEIHQRAMNSKLFKRTLQTSLGELVNLDKNLIEQMKFNSQAAQARVDPDTKAMLSDFLKAANNFKSGREMINCSQMFPKCTRTQLLAAANAHLNDPANGRAIGKFSQLMKKMKFKTNQQNVSQWKLRKPGKTNQQYLVQAARTTSANQPIDHMQVVPLQPHQSSAFNTASQLKPVDSLKLAQQIMMMSQMSQPQQQQQQLQQTSSSAMGQYTAGSMQPQAPQQQWMSQSTGNNQNQIQQQQPNYSAASNYNVPQYSPAPKQQTTYTDAMMSSVYSPTESPYFMSQPNNNANSQQQQPQPQQPQQQLQQYSANVYQDQSQSRAGQMLINTNQVQQSVNQQPQQQYMSTNHDQFMPQQQQQSANLVSNTGDNKGRPQQLVTGNKMVASPA